jgi:hypothetical protein
MHQETPQPKTSSLRGALGGISLLLLVAVALQASPGLTERSEAVGQRHGPVVRMIAEAVTRRAERRVRRLDERPVVAQAYPAVTVDRVDSLVIATPDLGVAQRHLGAWLTDLPPPALA